MNKATRHPAKLETCKKQTQKNYPLNLYLNSLKRKKEFKRHNLWKPKYLSTYDRLVQTRRQKSSKSMQVIYNDSDFCVEGASPRSNFQKLGRIVEAGAGAAYAKKVPSQQGIWSCNLGRKEERLKDQGWSKRWQLCSNLQPNCSRHIIYPAKKIAAWTKIDSAKCTNFIGQQIPIKKSRLQRSLIEKAFL